MTRNNNYHSTFSANREAYQGETILSATLRRPNDAWATGLNNNVLVLGASGSGKTRNFLKPNLMQCNGSYLVLDSKGALNRDMARFMEEQGYEVDYLDFTAFCSTLGYDPLDSIRSKNGRYCTQDVTAIASALCPAETSKQEPFWQYAAANYLTCYIAYVLEELPLWERNFASVLRIYEADCDGRAEALFTKLVSENPNSFAARSWMRAASDRKAEKMHSSIMGILAANLMSLGLPEVMGMFEMSHRIDFTRLGHEKRVLFVRIDDMDRSLDPLTSLFVQQALTALCDEADNKCEGGRLPVPVHFMLDDFANLRIDNFDAALSVIRSREVSATVVCQTVSQLEALYGKDRANSIIGNCDSQVVLGFQDMATARYYSERANKTANALFETAAGSWWVFQRGHRARCDAGFTLENHALYAYLQHYEGRPERFRDAGDGAYGGFARPIAHSVA